MLTPRRLRTRAAFTLVELMIVVAIIGILAMVAIPQFTKYMRKARTAEAVINLKKMYDGTVTYYATEQADVAGNILPRTFPAEAGPTPVENHCCPQTGQKCKPDSAQWETPAWQSMSFSIEDPHYFWYLTKRPIGDGKTVGDRYDLQARANLDCDTNFSLFQRSATVDAQFALRGSSGLFIQDETE